jgi:pimeloyl-ACP methyl ester carboxylesterase
VIPLLAPHHRVIAPDLRGLGDSTGPAGYDKRTLADDVIRLMRDELGIRPLHLDGHDWGGVEVRASLMTDRYTRRSKSSSRGVSWKER